MIIALSKGIVHILTVEHSSIVSMDEVSIARLTLPVSVKECAGQYLGIASPIQGFVGEKTATRRRRFPHRRFHHMDSSVLM